MANPQAGAAGVVIEMTVGRGDGTPVDLSAASKKDFVFRTPSGTVMTKAASFVTDGQDGKLRYVTTAGDLVPAGLWELQADIIIAGFSGRTARVTFRVEENI